MSSFGLENKHVFVSGASGGIGLVTAAEFLRTDPGLLADLCKHLTVLA